MAKQLIKNYSYNTTSKTVTLTDFTTVSLDRLQLITDVTTNTIIYNFADSSVATATVAGNVITLSAAPGSNTDKLMVIYDAASGDPTYDGYKELASLSAGSLNADLVPSTDVSAFKWISLHVTGTYNGTLSFSGSNDGTNWVNVNLARSDQATGAATPTNSFTTGTGLILHGPATFRYFRARMTVYTSGTATGTLELFTNPTVLLAAQPATQVGTWTVGSNSATGSAVPANAFYLAANAGGNLNGLTALGGGVDTAGNSVTQLNVAAYGYSFNGTSHDRLRSATSASGTTGTGVPAAGMLGFDGTNYQRVKTDTSGNQTVIGSATGSAVPSAAFYVGMKDNVGSLRGMESVGSASPNAVASQLLASGPYVYNGSSYDIIRSATGAPTGTTAVAPRPATSGGVTVAKIASAATTNATSVKASAGQIYGWSLFNTSASTKYLKFYNKATAPAVGTDVPVFIVPIAASGSVNIMLGDIGTPLATGIAYAITGAVADTDTTAVALNDVVGSVFYS